ncbi:MAG: SDR family NAD(P)-dependent oxidoreductase [Betaproteobacteria bacterium]
MFPITFNPQSNLLLDRNILITGATGGIGKALSLACAKLGATILLHGRNIDELNKIYDAIMGLKLPEPFLLPLDLSTASASEFKNIQMVVSKATGKLDGIVHCANMVSDLGPLHSQTTKQWEDLFRVNVSSVFGLNQALLPCLSQSDSASIVITSDHHARTLDNFWGGYAVTKAALEAYAKLQHNELHKEQNLRVNIVVPGPINSPMRSKTHPGEDREKLPSIESIIPLYVWLLSSESQSVSGQTFNHSS